MNKIIVAIDGNSGCGKSSTAKNVAKYLGYRYIDSGAMYRATTYHFIQRGVDISDDWQIEEGLKGVEIDFSVGANGESDILLNGVGVENEIRSMEVNAMVSQVSAISAVRKEMVRQQRETGKNKGVVMDGRDIGTVVFPDAELKVFMTATLEIRANRRLKELEGKGIKEELSVIKDNLKERDRIDSSRADSPLKKAKDAIELDTTYLTFDEQVHKIVVLAEEKINES